MTDQPVTPSPRETARRLDESAMRSWMKAVVRAWKDQWRLHKDHRYGRDFAAFVGERLLTDFSLRDLEQPTPAAASDPVTPSRDSREALREALTEWDAIEGTSLSDQFKAFIAAGTMADAIRAALANPLSEALDAIEIEARKLFAGPYDGDHAWEDGVEWTLRRVREIGQ